MSKFTKTDHPLLGTKRRPTDVEIVDHQVCRSTSLDQTGQTVLGFKNNNLTSGADLSPCTQSVNAVIATNINKAISTTKY